MLVIWQRLRFCINCNYLCLMVGSDLSYQQPRETKFPFYRGRSMGFIIIKRCCVIGSGGISWLISFMKIMSWGSPCQRAGLMPYVCRCGYLLWTRQQIILIIIITIIVSWTLYSRSSVYYGLHPGMHDVIQGEKVSECVVDEVRTKWWRRISRIREIRRWVMV